MVILQQVRYLPHPPLVISVAEPEPGAGAAGATTFGVASEPEPIFLLVGAGVDFLRRLWLWLHLLGKLKRKALFLCQT